MNKPTRIPAGGSAVCFGAAARDLLRIGSALAVALTALAAWTGLAVARPPVEELKEKGITVQAKEPLKVSQDRKLVDPPPGYDPKPPQPMKPEDVKGPHPVAKPDEEAHDFGQTWVGPTLAHSFKITNGGDAPLEISRVKPSCGCTIAGNYPKTIAPGETGEFPFSLASNKLRGHFEKSITISSNDPVTPDLRLSLKGEVKRYVEVTPPSANFARITTQEPQERIVNLTNNTDNPLKLTLEQPADSKFKAELVEKTPGKQFDLRISAVPPFEPGNLRTTVTLKTNIPEQNEVTVDVNGIVPARLEVQPSVVLVNPPRGEETTGVSRVVRFTNYGKNPVKVLEATVDDPAITVNVSERKAGESYTVQVQMPAGYQPPATGKNITLKTDDTEQPTITVPIQGSALVQQQKVTDAVQAKKLDPTAAPSPAPSPSPAPTTAPTPAPAPAPTPAHAPVVTPVVPIAAPAFKLTTIDGKEVTNESIKGSVVVLDFFAPNCGYCKKQIPRVEPIRAEYVEKGVRFINVSQKMGSKDFTQDEVLDMLKQLGFRGEVALDHTNTVGQAFQASGFPTMVILNKEGKVAVTNVGNIGDLEDRMKKQLDALIAGKPIPNEVAAAPTAPDAPKPAAPESMVGKAAPEIALKTVEGKDVTNAAYAQAPATVLDFFAVNCGYCVKQIPRLETVRKTYAEKGVRFINVQMKMGQEFSEEDAKKKMADLSWGGELARDMTNGSGLKYGASGFPTMVIVGKNGKIEAVNVGNIGDLETKVAAQLDAILAGKPIPANLAEAPKPAAPESMVGKAAPEIALKTVDGKDLNNAGYAGTPATVLDFFAVNCGYCVKQIPRLETIRKKYTEKGIRFVNVQMKMGQEFSEEDAKKKMTDLSWGGELARDMTNGSGQKYGASGFPTMVIVGKNGKIEAVNVGNIDDLETKVAAQLDAILAGKPASTVQAAAPPPAVPPAAVPPGTPSAALPAAPPGTPTAPGQPQAERPKRPAEELIGTQAPSFSLKTVDGKTVSSDEYSKHPAMVLNFVAPNCGFCKKQLPNVDKVRAEYEVKGIRFVNIYQKMGTKDFEPAEAIDIFKQVGSNLELAKDTGNEIGLLFKASSYPTMVIVGKDGKIEQVNVGAKPDIEQVVKSQLDALIAKK